MTYYLYKKTHNQTGLRYLGKTESDPYNYRGSGKRWTNHLNVHGNDVTTEVLMECASNDEIKKWGEYYLSLWNIVESDNWANLKPESGNGGSYPHREDTKVKMSLSRKNLPDGVKCRKWSQDQKDTQSLNRAGKNNPMYGKMVVNNGIANITIDKNESIPTGYVSGSIQKMGNKKGKPDNENPNFGKHWITDGLTNIMINKLFAIPPGWQKGRV